MAKANLDQLFMVAENSPLLDRVEGSLRTTGHHSQADQLYKLQQDVGVQIDIEMMGTDITQPAPGPDTARLWSAYKEVTSDRIRENLNDCGPHLEPGLRMEFAVTFLSLLKRTTPPPPPSAPVGPT